MYRIKFTGEFKHQMKLCQRRGYDMELLKTAIRILSTDGKLPAEYLPHVLHGDRNGIFSGVEIDPSIERYLYRRVMYVEEGDLVESFDGANKAQRIWHVDIPGILPTITILLILRSGSIMNVGFQKVYLMQTSLNLSRSEILSTYVYKVGLENGDFSFSTAVGMFNSVVNFILIISVNAITRRLSETSLW